MTLTPAQLRRAADAIELRLGMRFGDRPAVIAELVARRSAARHETEQVYVAHLAAPDPDELRAIAEEVSVGETYFFRHAEQFAAYADLLPALAAQGGALRILSAGCSSGEEPYTLAIVAQERLAEPQRVTIEAVDFNPAAIARARAGRYTTWSLRATSAEHDERWFTHDSRGIALAPRIRNAVQFVEANLVDPEAGWGRGTWHVVFCRNVLMYLGAPHALRLVERLAQGLAPGGYLFLGHAETLRDYPSVELELCHTHGTFYYRRAERAGAGNLDVLAPPPIIAPPAPIVLPPPPVFPVVVVPPALPAPPPAAPPDDLAPIRALVRDERFAEALAALAGLPPAIATTGDAMLLGAVVATQQGETPVALAAARELVTRGEHRASASYLLAICFDSTGDLAASERHAREALAIDPTFAMARVQLAFLARRRGDRALAADHFAHAVPLLEREEPARLELFGGGFDRAALVQLCRGELAGRGAS